MDLMVSMIGYVAAIVSVFIAWMLKTSADESAQRLNVVEQERNNAVSQLQEVQRKISQSEERMEKATNEFKRLREQVQGAKGDAKAKEKELRDELQAKIDELASIDRKGEHTVEQIQVLTSQLKEADRERKAAEVRADRAEQELHKRIDAAKADAEARLEQIQSESRKNRVELAAVQTKLSAAEAELKQGNPEDVKRLKKKIAQLEHLLTSMRGLKEMAEERNQNWEVALKILAKEQMRTRGIKLQGNESLGLLVSSALELLGTELVNDDPSTAVAATQESTSTSTVAMS
jgi:chromosome segregation ATPase